MRTIIAGSRGASAADTLSGIFFCPFVDRISHVISGGARGPDSFGEWYADQNRIPFAILLADWSKHGRAAGPLRNAHMADMADALIAIWDGKSKGTANMIDEAKSRGLAIFVYQY